MPQARDLLICNGNLLTLDPARPAASAMLVRGGRIVAVGTEEECFAQSHGPMQRLDADGKTVTPGFIDCHVHLYWYGMQLLKQADLVGTRDVDDLQTRLSELAGRTSGWIQGHGFDQSKMAEKRFITRAELDKVSSTRPILVSRICGHAVVVNSAALACISQRQRQAGDETTGLYTEAAIEPFYAAIPGATDDEAEAAVLLAADKALASGITCVQTLLDNAGQMKAYASLRRKGKLPLRVVGMPPHSVMEQLHALGVNSTFGDDWLRFGAVKLFADGSLGAQTALLRQPYADKPGELGIRMYEPQDLKHKCRSAQEKGFQLAIHAIGDQAVRETIDAIEFALAGESNALHRHRIEHASVTCPESMQRLQELQIVVTAQPQFVTSDTWTAQRLGPERSPWAYPFKTMLQRGIRLGLSSDCPVEKLDALDCIAAAVGRHPWSPGEALTVEQALDAYCMGSAYAAHLESRQGSLTPGKLADFLVLSRDPRHCSPEQIRQIRAEQVFVNGQRIERS